MVTPTLVTTHFRRVLYLSHARYENILQYNKFSSNHKDIMESESTCFLMKNDFNSKPWSPRLPNGMRLEVTHHPFNLRKVVNLIIATEKFKGAQKLNMGTEFRDEDLVNFLLEAFEEQIVLEEEASVFNAATTNVPTLNSASEEVCNITDTENKSWVLTKEDMELRALLLQGGNESQKVLLNLSRYKSAVPIQTDGIPVALNIKGSNLYLSCSKSETTPILKLEEVENKDQLKSIKTESEMTRFLFYRKVTGRTINTLESFQSKGWFISAAIQDDSVVDMCQMITTNRINTFNIIQE
ncbi:hypothetical protein UPYG_G00179400 [Umbra pygmaea]|uniref:Interleukin-1 n=1 Tax=Umbra pygmaea TaxID=75934 RepID=A0ABD0WUT7_UMBPY